MEDWLTLPQLARELNVADSTARRWAGLFPDLMPTNGRGSGRRFHPVAREVLKRVQRLYDQGLRTEQISELLHKEFTALVDVDDTQADLERNNTPMLNQLTAAVLQLAEQQAQLRDEIATTRDENRELRTLIEERLDARNRVLVETLRELQAAKQRKRRWPWSK